MMPPYISENPALTAGPVPLLFPNHHPTRHELTNILHCNSSLPILEGNTAMPRSIDHKDQEMGLLADFIFTSDNVDETNPA